MEVAVNPLHQILNPGLAAVVGVEYVCGQLPDPLVVVRIDANLAVVHRTRIHVAYFAPGLAAIVGTKRAALGVFNERVNYVWVAKIDIETDATGDALRQSLRQLVP